ncbi:MULTISPECIES: cystathionine beta-synthase [Streptomyces]|uniref:Cystathionine beta-synthase n=1 Tax=Streptomyces lycii TaxID=2654337 RepID=A0ABQ7FKS1_9ACTN|nr:MULTISPECIES: cystathionine beta-synthase [Streptomyces]KAF4409554.1 cystathionine beta-synthase [Streptomyces lycii]PGH48102.1 cystathionine beta-synthase [Streptomyces sp. Ru87]
MDYVDDICDLIGDTPLVRIGDLAAGLEPLVLAKVEYLNPGGSSKDRIAQSMIDAAEKSGQLRPGGTIVEPTSGNTGVGLALVARRRGYRCVSVCPDKVSESKRDTLKAYGAEVVVCPTSVPPDHPDSYYSVSDRLARDIPGAWKPDQYSNPENPASHYRTTGPEIWQQTRERVTHFVAGIGTGGTISGVGRYLKEVSGGRVRIVGADPEGSVYSGGTGRPYLVEGVGEDMWPQTFDKDVCDEVVRVTDAESFAVTRRLAREEGLLVGGSCGLAVAAALKVARGCGPDDVIVVLLPDGGRGYLAKIFNDTWMAAHGFLPPGGEMTGVGDLLRAKAAPSPHIVHVHPDQTMAQAAAVLREHGVSQMPVVNAEPPVTAGEVVGSVNERDLLDALITEAAGPGDPVGRHMSAPLPTVGAGVAVGDVMPAFAASDGLLVFDGGKAVGVVTRQDVLGHVCAAGGEPVRAGTQDGGVNEVVA